MNILVVEDEANLAEALAHILRENHWNVDVVDNGKDGLAYAKGGMYAAVVLDVMLPQMDGFEVCRRLREVGVSTPVLMLTARSETKSKVLGLDAGADDYLTKPFGTVELLARIRTALRHTRKACGGEELREGQYIVGDLVIDYNKHRAYLGGEDAGLTPSEFKILALLGRYAGRVLTYQQMLRELWGPAANPRDNKLLRVHMANLRRKLEKNPEEPRYLFTEVGVGYRLAEGEGTEPLESDSTEETEE